MGVDGASPLSVLSKLKSLSEMCIFPESCRINWNTAAFSFSQEGEVFLDMTGIKGYLMNNPFNRQSYDD